MTPYKNIIVGIVYESDDVDYEDFNSQIEVAFNTMTKEKKRGFIMSVFIIDLLKYNHNHHVLIRKNFVFVFVFCFLVFFFRASIGLLEFAQLKIAPRSR